MFGLREKKKPLRQRKRKSLTSKASSSSKIGAK
jgi:hypothetical protein